MISVGLSFICLIIIVASAISLMIAITMGLKLGTRIVGWLHNDVVPPAARVAPVEQTPSVTPAINKPDPPVSHAMARCFVAPTIVMTVFFALSAPENRDWHFLFSQPVVTDAIVIHADSPQSSDSAIQIHENELAPNRPKWISDGDSTSGDLRKIVLSSRLWSTEAEAQQELTAKAGTLLREDFEQRHHGLPDPSVFRFLNSYRITKVAVKERYLERIEQDFGKFTAPMNRLWWQVEISPTVRTELYPAWKAEATQNRVAFVGAILALFTMIANAVGLYAQRRHVPTRNMIQAVTPSAICVVVWTAVDIFVTRQMLS